MNQLFDRYLSLLKVEATTREGYESIIRTHTCPLLGPLALSRIDSEVLDSLLQAAPHLPRCARLGWDMNIHQLRHYSATELISSGVDITTVSGRLGHGGEGSTTLRFNSAWVPEADQRAASTLAGRMPAMPVALNDTGTLVAPAPHRQPTSPAACSPFCSRWTSRVT